MSLEIVKKLSKKLANVSLYLTISALVVSIPIIVLSIFNFGLSSRWFNGGASIVTLVFCLIVLGIKIWERMRAGPEESTNANAPLPSPKTPKTPKTPTSALWKASGSLPVSQSLPVVCLFLLLALLHLIAFILMVSITIEGAVRSTLPAERDPSVTYPWNIKVQIGQTACIGVQTLILIACFGTGYAGRSRVTEAENELRDEIEWGVTEAPK